MLYFVPTPIGNMEDITLRSLELFRKIKYFFCEDTRTTKKLLGLLDIDFGEKEFYSLTSFTRGGKIRHYLNIIREHDAVAVSEAGTPGLSDPGKTLVQYCTEQDLQYSILPGANALVPSVVASAFDTSKFVFLGFFPQKKGRVKLLQQIVDGYFGDLAIFFYESVHRIEKTLRQLEDYGFDGKICICREISKMHEQVVNNSLAKVLQMIELGEITMKGEFVLGLQQKK